MGLLIGFLVISALLALIAVIDAARPQQDWPWLRDPTKKH